MKLNFRRLNFKPSNDTQLFWIKIAIVVIPLVIASAAEYGISKSTAITLGIVLAVLKYIEEGQTKHAVSEALDTPTGTEEHVQRQLAQTQARLGQLMAQQRASAETQPGYIVVPDPPKK